MTTTTAQNLIALQTACEKLQAGYLARKTMLDDDMIGHVQGITDHATLILQMITACAATEAAGAPVALKMPSERQTELCDKLEAFCKAEGLECRSADEMLLRDDLTDDQRKWLQHFVNDWEEWEQFDSDVHEASKATAQAEGWGIFSTRDDESDKHIERDDEADKFESDDDALAHVRRCAAAGSLVHRAALERCKLGAAA